MREKLKKILAILLVVGFSFTSIPTSLVSYASMEAPEEYLPYEEEYEAEIPETETVEESEPVLVTFFEHDEDDMHVTVQLSEADGLPEGTTFVLRQVYEDSHDETDRGIYHWAHDVLHATLDETGVIPLQAFYYDLYFEHNGERLHPTKPFEVYITWGTDQPFEPDAAEDHVRVYRISEEGSNERQKAVDTDAQTEITERGSLSTAKFTIDSYQHSPLMIALIETKEEHDARIAAEEALAAEEEYQAEVESPAIEEQAYQPEENISIITNEDDEDTESQNQIIYSGEGGEETPVQEPEDTNIIVMDDSVTDHNEPAENVEGEQEAGAEERGTTKPSMKQ